MARRVLFVQTAFLGDAVLATAAWEVWHAQFPEDEIGVVVRKGNEGLFEGHPWLGEGAVHVWAKSQPGRYLRLLALGLHLRGRYDCVIAIQRHTSSGILALLSGARLRIGYATHPLARTFHRAVDHVLGDGRHETERLLDLVTAAAAALAARAGTPRTDPPAGPSAALPGPPTRRGGRPLPRRTGAGGAGSGQRLGHEAVAGRAVGGTGQNPQNEGLRTTGGAHRRPF